jgi:hypothetical protein
MAPINVARGLAEGRHQELPAEAERRRLIVAVPALALRAHGPLAI